MSELNIANLRTQSTPNPHTHALLARAHMPVILHDEPEFAQYSGKLARFMNFWGKIEGQFFSKSAAR